MTTKTTVLTLAGRCLLVFLLGCFATVRSQNNVYTNATSSTGYTYPFAYFNISTEPGGGDVGFVQIFSCSPTRATVYFSMMRSVFNQYDLVERTDTLNLTISYNAIVLTGKPVSGTAIVRPYGLIVAADSETFVYAVKSDRGTTDGYLILPLTTNSTEFIIAGWKVDRIDFFAGLIIVSALPDTCVEIYTISEGGTKYTFTANGYLPHAYGYIEYFMSTGEDSTTLYVNSSRPITVLTGTSCGQVDTTTRYCDHMAEVMPPISELGLVHVVPPIHGRSTAAGYLVRVVASNVNTTVTWTDVGGTATVGVTNPGVGYDIITIDASVPILIVCDKPCVVVLYNKGILATLTESSYTDPFTMVITPVEHYVNGSCFGTALFCLSDIARINFNNFLSVATAIGNKQDIQMDGQPIAAQYWTDIGEYSVGTQPVSPGFHMITSNTGSTFGGWAYGHSLSQDSTSAYGYPIAYKVFGEPVNINWIEADKQRDIITQESLTDTCQRPNITDGSAVASYNATNVTSPVPYVLYQPILLDATLKTPVALTVSCRTAYIRALRDLMTSTFRYINYQICTRAMCGKITGDSGGVKVSDGNFTAGIYPTRLYVAIDSNIVEQHISFDTSDNKLTAIHLTITYVGILDTNADSFSQCRTEIRDFLIPFVDWLTLNNNGYVPATAASLSSSTSQATLSTQQQQLIANNQLLQAPSPCPTLVFAQPKFAFSLPNRCDGFWALT